MKTNNLKPCPLCGSTNINAINDTASPVKFCRVHCQDCGISWHTYIDGTFDRWNTRPIEDGLRAEIETRDKRIAELETEKECEMRVIKDGNAWCFVLPDFENLQVSSSFWMDEGVLDKIYKELRSVK